MQRAARAGAARSQTWERGGRWSHGCDRAQVVGVDLQEREVGELVAADDSRLIFLAVGQSHRDAVDGAGAVGALDQMVVGDDIAVRRDDEAGPERAHRARCLLLATAVFHVFSLVPEASFLVWGWRVPFLLGIVLLGIGLWLCQEGLKAAVK